jgi:hypothetical protein
VSGLLDERRSQNLGALYRGADDELAQILFYGLYFGELRHLYRVTARTVFVSGTGSL